MSVADKINRLTAARDGIRTALAGQGVAAGSHGFEAFASDIAAISGGTVATATKTPTSATQKQLSFSVQGQPKMFAVIATGTISSPTGRYIVAAVYDGSEVFAQYKDEASTGALAGLTQSYNNGTLQISTSSVTGNWYWAKGVEYKLVYVY